MRARLVNLILIPLLAVFVSAGASADTKGYRKNCLEGAGCMDAIDGAALGDGDHCNVAYGGHQYLYVLDADSAASESGVEIIAPSANAGDKRWIRQDAYRAAAGDSATSFFASGTVEAARLPVVSSSSSGILPSTSAAGEGDAPFVQSDGSIDYAPGATKSYVDDKFASDETGAAYDLIGAYTLSSETANITINNINGNTDDHLLILYSLSTGNDGNSLRLRYNGDSGSNYYGGSIYESNDAAVGLHDESAKTNAYIGYIYANTNSAGKHEAHLRSGRQRISYGTDVRANTTDNAAHMGIYFNYWTNTADEVTSIKIYSDAAASGTIKVYKLKPISAKAVSVTCADATDTCAYTEGFGSYYLTSGSDAAADVMTISDGFAGQKILFKMKTDGGNDISVEFTNGTDCDDFTAAGDFCFAEFDGTNWFIINQGP